MKNLKKSNIPFLQLKSRRRGAAMVEMAFVVTILLTLTLGLIQWGVIMNTTVAITNLSREGARYAAVHWEDNPVNVTGPKSDDAIAEYIRAAAPASIKRDDLVISISPATTARQARQAITVTISYDMKKKLFLPEAIFDAVFFSGTYKSAAQMMME